ncbi:hypothetical protein FRB94_006162 [Tulasnella sp. JGI-2019a]|nr:hypothetical protein FRB94_006162 [Tulasnella sp. JGI-2019a]
MLRIPRRLHVLLAFSVITFITLITSGVDIRLTSPSNVVLEQPNPPPDVTAPVPSFTVPKPKPKPKPKPRISIIVIWEGDYRPYLNTFFTSVRANADTVELVWIDMGKRSDYNCLDVSPWAGASGQFNVKTFCYSQQEYWALHRDYFCGRWGCTFEDSERVLQEMVNRQTSDPLKSAFRLWRGYVFQHLVDPSVEWWGWADPDTFMGSFRS